MTPSSKTTQPAAVQSRQRWMILFRSLYLLAIIATIIAGRWNQVWFNLFIFLGSLFVPLLGRRDSRFYLFDVAVCAVFLASMGAVLTGTFLMEPSDLGHTIFSVDKLFHATAGACLAIFAWLYLDRRVKDPVLLFFGILCFAVAMGAIWEVFEWIASLLPPPYAVASAGYADTMLDLVADTIGGMIVAAIAWKRSEH